MSRTVAILLAAWLPVFGAWAADQGVFAPLPAPPAPAPGRSIATGPLRLGVGRPVAGPGRPLRPSQVTLFLRQGSEPGVYRLFHEGEPLGELRAGPDGKLSGSAFAAAIDRSTLWIVADVELAREPEVPLAALHAVSRALMVGGVLKQRFRVLEPGE
ncbi:MAG: hypothetical protein R3F62_28550 [Planctomycetota bacterium]